MAFIKADRTATFARIGLTGPTNAGKTTSAIRIAQGIVKQNLSKKGNKNPTQEEIDAHIAVIDSERGRAKFYANRNEKEFKTGHFFHANLTPPYTVRKYIENVEEGANLVGEDGVVIIDSLSHAWAYTGGLLEVKTNMETKRGVNSFTAWNEAGQMQNDMVDRVLSVNCHLIATLRSKMNYVMETGDDGKTSIKQVGLKPVQRDDLEYEFDITLMLEKETHHARIIKDTTYLTTKKLPDGTIGLLNEKFGEELIKWLDEGIDPHEIAEEERISNVEKIQTMCKANPDLIMTYKKFFKKKSRDLDLNETRKALNELYKVQNLYDNEGE